MTKEESITACMNRILTSEGKIDILVNNAGFGSYGAIEDVSMKDARYQLDVNVLGAMRLVQLVLPTMRKNKYGKIVNVSSVGGKIVFPLGGWYHASKFALEALSDALRNEVREFGIHVIVIEPGATKSEWGAIAFDSMVNVSGQTAYKELTAKVYKAFAKQTTNMPEAITIAELIKKGIEADNPKTRYVGGTTTSLLLAIRKSVSDKLMDKLILSQLK